MKGPRFRRQDSQHLPEHQDGLDRLAARVSKEVLRQLRTELRRDVKEFVASANVDLGRLDYPNAEIFLRLGSVWSLMRRHSCAKEPWTVEWIERSVAEGDVLYDIGANVGAYSLVAAIRGAGTVVAIEPATATFAELCENIVLNGVQSRVVALPVGLAARTAMATLEYRDTQAGAASHRLVEASGDEDDSRSPLRQRVLAYRLDDLVETFALPRPNHIKLDVDGAESDVLAGAEETLAAPALRSVMVEVHADGAEEVAGLMAARGLDLRAEYAREGRENVDHWYALYERE